MTRTWKAAFNLLLLSVFTGAAFPQQTIGADSDEAYYMFFKVFASHDAHLQSLGASGSPVRSRAEQTFARRLGISVQELASIRLKATDANTQIDQNRLAWANDMKRYTTAQGAPVNSVERDQVWRQYAARQGEILSRSMLLIRAGLTKDSWGRLHTFINRQLLSGIQMPPIKTAMK